VIWSGERCGNVLEGGNFCGEGSHFVLGGLESIGEGLEALRDWIQEYGGR